MLGNFPPVILAENGRLRYIDLITKRFLELTMAHKGEVKAIVTTVMVSLVRLQPFWKSISVWFLTRMDTL